MGIDQFAADKCIIEINQNELNVKKRDAMWEEMVAIELREL